MSVRWIWIPAALLATSLLPACGGSSDTCSPVAETCNGVDDDCDGEIDEGNPGGGGACSTGLLGVCSGGTLRCASGGLSCVQDTQPATETCDGLDDDCDGELDEGCACVGGEMQACFTGPAGARGVGTCSDGVQTCTAGAWGACAGEQLPVVETCNGLDDDCNGLTDDGDPGGGAACATGLPGVCATGAVRCVSAALACVQDVAAGPELCNGLDDDCDPGTPDGSGDPLVGAGCDGPDGDLCAEGVRSCVAGGLVCSDATGTTVDLCNGLDDDCNPATPDGSGDPLVGTGCDGPDGDLCAEGVRSCVAGGLVCSDATGTTVELCAGDGQDEDCDGQVDEGFVRNDDPACASGAFYMGAVSGDTGSGVLTDSWYNEEWQRFRVTEDSGLARYVSATVRLQSPPGVDFDLYVYCASCGGAFAGSSTAGGLSGHVDTVNVRRDDSWAVDDSFDVIVEVRHFASNLCAYWDLTVTGNTTVSTTTCN